MADGYVLQEEPRGVTWPVHLTMSRLLKLTRDGLVSDTLVDFAARFASDLTELRWATHLVPLPLWEVCGEELVLLDPFAIALHWLDRHGEVRRTHPLEFLSAELRDGDARRYMVHTARAELMGQVPAADLDRRVEQALQRYPFNFGTRSPPAVRLLCDSEQRAWLQLYSTEHDPLGHGPQWLVVSSAGVVGLVDLPVGFTPWLILREYAVGAHRADPGGARLARVPLRWL